MTTPRVLPELVVPARRRFLARLGIGSTAIGALLGWPSSAHAQSPAAAAAPGTPRRHAVDDWMDQIPTAHRTVFDAVSAEGCADVRHYAYNILSANGTGYSLESRDVGIIIILRHNATPFAYNDAMWAKYGRIFSDEMKLVDPKTQKPPVANPGNVDGETLDGLSAQGVQFGACAMATGRLARLAAKSTGGTADAILEELGKNLIRNAHLTPAGIVAVGRAQERGCTFGYAG